MAALRRVWLLAVLAGALTGTPGCDLASLLYFVMPEARDASAGRVEQAQATAVGTDPDVAGSVLGKRRGGLPVDRDGDQDRSLTICEFLTDPIADLVEQFADFGSFVRRAARLWQCADRCGRGRPQCVAALRLGPLRAHRPHRRAFGPDRAAHDSERI